MYHDYMRIYNVLEGSCSIFACGQVAASQICRSTVDAPQTMAIIWHITIGSIQEKNRSGTMKS